MTKFVLRFLDDRATVLGWVEVQAFVPGNGTLVAPPVEVTFSKSGTVKYLSIHWADVNVERTVQVDVGTPVVTGLRVIFKLNEPLWIIGPPAGGLPPIEVGSTVIGMLPGVMGAMGNA